MFGGLDACVGHEQGGFQFFVQRIVNLSAREDSRQTATRFFESGFEFAKPSLPTGFGRCVCFCGRLCPFWGSKRLIDRRVLGFGAEETEHEWHCTEVRSVKKQHFFIS